MNISCYIVDDEFHSIEMLKEHILQTPGLELMGYAENPLIAINEIQLLRPDLIFLDIGMPEMSGLTLADMFSFTSTIVFTTSYSNYAVDAFEKQVFDYLLKPITYERFSKCMFNVRKDFQLKSQPEKGDPGFFYIKTNIKGKLIKIDLAEILFVEAAENYVLIYSPSGKQIAYLTISEIAEYLPKSEFSRVHKSFIIHHAAINSLEPGQVKLKSDISIPLGRAYKDDFQKKMQHLVLKSRREV